MADKKLEKRSTIAFLVLFLIFVVIDSYITDKKTQKFFDYILEHYPTLRVSDSLNNRIVAIYEPPKNLPISGIYSVKYLVLDNNEKHKVAITEELSGVYFSEVAKIGAKVIKPAGSDTVTVIYGGKEYRFILCKDAFKI